MRFHILCSGLIILFLVGCQTTRPPMEDKTGVQAPAIAEKEMVEGTQYEDVAVIETEKGTIRFKFYPEDAPQAVANFTKLANDKFYDGLTFHRVVKEPRPFVIQGGDPKGDGSGGPGYTIPDEFNARPHLEGTVAMARPPAPSNSAGSQFYICLAAQPHLDGKYTVFGQTIEGFDVVQRIQKGDVMKSVRIEKQMISS